MGGRRAAWNITCKVCNCLNNAKTMDSFPFFTPEARFQRTYSCTILRSFALSSMPAPTRVSAKDVFCFFSSVFRFFSFLRGKGKKYALHKSTSRICSRLGSTSIYKEVESSGICHQGWQRQQLYSDDESSPLSTSGATHLCGVGCGDHGGLWLGSCGSRVWRRLYSYWCHNRRNLCNSWRFGCGYHNWLRLGGRRKQVWWRYRPGGRYHNWLRLRRRGNRVWRYRPGRFYHNRLRLGGRRNRVRRHGTRRLQHDWLRLESHGNRAWQKRRRRLYHNWLRLRSRRNRVG